MPVRKWTTEENLYLMESAYNIPWPEIAEKLGRTEGACKAHFNKIYKLRNAVNTWRGLGK